MEFRARTDARPGGEAELLRLEDPLTGSNCYILGCQGGAAVIDPNRPDTPTACLEARGWAAELILLTHEHCDHTAGLDALRDRWPRAKAVAAVPCSAGLQDEARNMSRWMEVFLTFQGKRDVRYPPFTCRPADLVFDGSWQGVWRGHAIRCVSLPGHTPGSCGIFWDEGLFFSGDYLIPGAAAALRLPGGSARDYEARTRPFLEGLPGGLRILPGHGLPYTLERKAPEAHHFSSEEESYG